MPELYPMNGGDGEYSYTKNSSFQREAINDAMGMIDEAIASKLEVKDVLGDSSSFNIADLGCSVGPNTFLCVENIIEDVKIKYQSQDLKSQIPEFQVFFSDHTFNDFNTLFRSLPNKRPYFAAGVPGSFHRRLFPNSSLQFVHTSTAIHWLSQLPKEIVDEKSSAWNKGKITYASAPDEVGKSYAAQFAKDMEVFLDARAKEIVGGGMMVIIVPGISDGTPISSSLVNVTIDLLGCCLMDMAKEGLISEAQVDSFNLPLYYPSPKELAELVEANGCFITERIKSYGPVLYDTLIRDRAEQISMHYRAGFEAVFSKHFESEIIDELFDRYPKKIKEYSSQVQGIPFESMQLFLALKRK